MVLENGFLLYAQAALDNGTTDAAGLIQIGSAQSGGGSSDFTTKLCADVDQLIPCSSLYYRAPSSAVGFSSMGFAVTTDASSDMQNQGWSPGSSAQYVLVQVGYKRKYFIPWAGKIVSASSSALMELPQRAGQPTAIRRSQLLADGRETVRHIRSWVAFAPGRTPPTHSGPRSASRAKTWGRPHIPARERPAAMRMDHDGDAWLCSLRAAQRQQQQQQQQQTKLGAPSQ